MLAVAVPVAVAPEAGISGRAVAAAVVRPALPALVVAAVVLGAAWAAGTDTLLELLPVGVAWAVLAGAAIWRFGLTVEERRSFARQVGAGRAAAPLPDV